MKQSKNFSQALSTLRLNDHQVVCQLEHASMFLNRSLSLLFWINPIDDFNSCYNLRPSNIKSLYLLLPPLMFPITTMFLNGSVVLDQSYR